MSKNCALSTYDNPFNPFEQFIPWFMYDIDKGYNCCGRLMRIAKIEDDFSQVEVDVEIERAIDRIVALDPTNTYIKVINKTTEINETNETGA